MRPLVESGPGILAVLASAAASRLLMIGAPPPSWLSPGKVAVEGRGASR